MSGHTEPTSNSTKFVPMPMSALLANLMTMPAPDSDNSSYSSIDDSDDSASMTSKNPTPKTTKEIQVPQSQPKDLYISTPKPGSHSSGMKAFASEKKYNRKEYNKENYCSNSLYYKTFPNKDQKDSVSRSLLRNEQLGSEVKKRSVLVSNQISNNLESDKRTLETPKVIPQSSQKLKPLTPIIKSGIRKFTPGSGRRSQKKTPTKLPLNTDRSSVKCLFPANNIGEEFHPPPSREIAPPVPETPLNKPHPMPYAATPSYPQGVVGNDSKMTLKTTAIKGKKYIYIKKLGIGGSSEVYKVIEVGTSCEYAVKCVDLATDKELAQGYVNEVRLLRELQKSDRVIRMFDYEYDRNTKFLRVVLEVGETDLSSFLKSRGTSLSSALVIHYWEEMLNAVHYIHEQGVIHADLKPANFLLVCGKLKLIDFGIASAVAVDATSVVRDHATGTYSYISPEALMGGAGGYGNAAGNAPIKITFKSDVWSLGCILYSMVYGRTPFSHLPNLAKLAAILNPNHKIDYPPVQHLPPSLILALKRCLTYNAKSRPCVRELLQIPYLQYPSTVPLPQDLLDRLQSCVTPQEFQLLQRARVEVEK